MITRTNPQASTLNGNNCVESSVKKFFATHRTMLKIISNFPVFFGGMALAKHLTSYNLLPSLDLSGRGILKIAGMSVAFMCSEIAKDFEKSLAASDAIQESHRVTIAPLEGAHVLERKTF